MNLSFLKSPRRNSAQKTVEVLVERVENGSFVATVIGLPSHTTQGHTKEEALTKLYGLLTAREAEVVSMKLEPSQVEHPWMKLAGKYKDDPHFDEMLTYIEADRRALDAEMEAYYQKIDAEDKAE